jgi:acetoin utilization deacetylase AcuC-like enzyme
MSSPLNFDEIVCQRVYMELDGRQISLPAVVVATEHEQHVPSWEINNGRVVQPPFDKPQRIERIAERLANMGCPMVDARKYDNKVVGRVHRPQLLQFLERCYAESVAAGTPDQIIPDTFLTDKLGRHGSRAARGLGLAGTYCFDTETPIVAGTWAAARSAVDAALTASELVLSGASAAYALCRPPGHHAGSDYYGGYCYLNNSAIAAERLRENGTVAILDIDYHHGNGTQDIFWSADSVTYISIHGDPDFAYPYHTGRAIERGERGGIFNYPLPLGTTDASYLRTLESALEVIGQRGVDFLVVSVGYDTSDNDPVGKFCLTASCYREIGRAMAALGKPTLLVQEGGYDLHSIGECADRLIRGLVSPTA